MQRTTRALALLGGVLLGTACLELPRHFTPVSLEEANALVADPGVTVVEAVTGGSLRDAALPGAIRWQLQDSWLSEPVPPGAVLVVGSSQSAAYRAAADLARGGNRTVSVFVPGSQEERSRLYAVASRSKEVPGGEDS